MIQRKIIDLENFPKGVTIFFRFKNIGNTFSILIKDADSREIYYKRNYEKPNLEVNLPVHPERIEVLTGAELESWIIQPLRIHKIEYQPNERIRIKRPYPISAIRIEAVGNLPQGSEARFLYNYGIIQYDRNKIARLPQPVRNFIFDHELGHYFYGRPIPNTSNMSAAQQRYYYNISLEDEKECDRFALYHGINKGYNFSGILNGIMSTLHFNGHYNLDRIMSVHDEIKQIHKDLNL